MEIAELVSGARAALGSPAGLLVALDFDGTLAPIVPDPNDSRPVPGTLEALRALSAAGARTAVVTGRDARTVVELGGLGTVPGLVVEGLYGAETWRDGELITPDETPRTRALRERLPVIVERHRTDERVWIEDKRLSLVVHGRLTDDPEGALDPLREPVAALAAELGLEVHPGRGVVEVRLPGIDKGGALRRLLDDGDGGDRDDGDRDDGGRAVLYAGDDLGDLPAFAAVRALRDAGRAAWSLGVVSGDVPGIEAAVDVTVPDPWAVVAVLERIAAVGG